MEEKDAGLLAAVTGALSVRAPSDPSAKKPVVASMPGLSQNQGLFDAVRKTLSESTEEPDTGEIPEASPLHKITDETTDHVNPALAALRARWA